MSNTKTLWTVIGALVLLLLAVTWSWYQSADKLHATAVVGDRTISEADWVQTLKEKHGQQVLADMINREAVFQEAKRLGITIDPARISAEMDQIRESYGSQTDDEFREALVKQGGTTPEALEREITYQMLLQELATRDIVIPEEELLAYYQKYADRYNHPLKVHLWKIVVASQTEAQQVVKELKNGANFNTLAKERSIDALTTSSGGDAGWVALTDDSLSSAEKDVISSLRLHTNSDPVEVKGKYVIYRVSARKEAEQVSFEQAKEGIRREMALAQVESLDAVLDRLKDSVGVEIGQMSN
ncbi:peptidyl-prolyl cis-trans isomerase [Brevibacillus ruminantium]|uniref:Peptidyl-prolyl cis-trans isomerase n=1 Tax=Brevibacillus ruminantium TaxID=2950604 RepID=A0ABY4WGQ9_9BACL|nr:peptidyl-prolyl cis-trans isomerase [Brevibacillus ruminantium]USG66001.1 peptidyl-prolyl cis-trans isomerase [Brevibacillus ruminantium]